MTLQSILDDDFAGNTDLIASKPETVLPLSDPCIGELRSMSGLAIGEMAGRDSVAAILAALENDDIRALLPVAVYMGAEYGDWQGFERNAAYVRRVARERFHKPVLDMIWLGSPRLWRALNGRYITEIVRRFGDYSPCLACHFYLHAIRIPLAIQVGAQIVVGGDRQEHNALVKINQIGAGIDAYVRFFHRFGLELREPLRFIGDVAEVDRILGGEWTGGSPQPDCMFSGNYNGIDGSRHWSDDQIMEYINQFVYPVLERVVAALVAQQPIDYLQVAREVLASRPTRITR